MVGWRRLVLNRGVVPGGNLVLTSGLIDCRGFVGPGRRS